MQNKRKNTYETLLPPVPESYRLRMEDALAALPVENTRTVSVGRFNKKQLIILIAALITLLTVSVTFAAAITRNQTFKELTNDTLDETIQTVTQPLNVESYEGWQPNHLILHDNVMLTKEDVLCPVSDGVMQLTELGYVGSQGITAEFFFHTERDIPCEIADLAVAVNDGSAQRAYENDRYVYTEGHYCGGAYFKCDGNPIWPGAIFTFTGKVNGEPFALTYMFTEKTYQTLQQGIVDAVNEHKAILEQIPDQGTPVGYELRNTILAEVSVGNHCMYFTTLRSPNARRYTPDDKLPYSKYDRGLWPVIDGRTGEFYYLGTIDAENPDGTVYCTYLPYSDVLLPQESLISFEGIVFRYEWETLKVTLPQDDTEYQAWRKESEELSERICETDWIWQFDEKLGDVSVTDLIFHTRSMWSDIGIAFESEQGFSDDAKPPKMLINGVELKHVGEIDPLTDLTPYVRSDKKKLAYRMVGYSPADLGETFTLTVEWRGSKKNITLHMSDVIREDAYEIKEYEALFHY